MTTVTVVKLDKLTVSRLFNRIFSLENVHCNFLSNFRDIIYAKLKIIGLQGYCLNKHESDLEMAVVLLQFYKPALTTT